MSSMTKRAGETKLVRLNVKIGARYVYLDAAGEALQLGGSNTLGSPKSAVEFVTPLPKSVQRKVRRALDAAGYRELAKATVAPQQLSFQKLDELAPYLNNFANRRDAEQTLHDEKVARHGDEPSMQEETDYMYHRYAMNSI